MPYSECRFNLPLCSETAWLQMRINSPATWLFAKDCLFFNKLYTAHKKFMNTSTSATSVASFILEGRYLENQTSQPVEILKHIISHGPLTDQDIIQNKTSKLPLKSLHNATAWFRPGLHGSEV